MAIGSSGLAWLAVCLAVLAAAADATRFRVGGQRGWSVPAGGGGGGGGAEPYNAWAGRMRFKIGDELLFVYPKGKDSVLVVEPAAYDACNATAYLRRFDDGSTAITLDRSGPFFFISGNVTSCRASQKLIVVVLAARGSAEPVVPAPAPVPAPSTTPPSAAPVFPGPAPAPSMPPRTVAPTPSPQSTSPMPPPSPSPSAVPMPAPAAAPESPPSVSAPSPAPLAAPPVSPPSPGGMPSEPPTAPSTPSDEGTKSTTPGSGAATVSARLAVSALAASFGYAMLAL